MDHYYIVFCVCVEKTTNPENISKHSACEDVIYAQNDPSAVFIFVFIVADLRFEQKKQ